MQSFSERSGDTELMDTESVDLEEFRACLKDLALVNTLTLTHRPVLAWLKQATHDLKPGDRVSLVDVAYGYGDLLRAIHRWCLANGFKPDLAGVDLNPWSAASAQQATPPDVQIEYRTGDVFEFEPTGPVQFIVSSQFTHHLSDPDAARFVAWMERTASRGWFISDLHRHPVPYYFFRIMARVAGWHRFVQHDGPVSIARSFRRADWVRIAAQAGLSADAIRITWHVPFRLCVGRIK
jgi:2-polyprenyl-3-methyl-5-hydroxy-6-metoxy-1,4-benzoquinol methylase